MTTNNTFSIARFGLLCRQNLIHNYKLLLTSAIGFCGGLFILLLIIQFLEGFKPLTLDWFISVLIFSFFATGIICAGTAFPAFRSKEKCFTYLMNPASAFEKFLTEFVSRILLFIVIVPLLYWAVYYVEASVVKLFLPFFSFESQMPFYPPDIHFGPEKKEWVYTVLISAGVLIFVIPFTGAAIFSKNALIKTLFGVAVIFFFNLLLVYFFVAILEFRKYGLDSILFMRDAEDTIVGAAIGSIVMNLGFIAAAYFKLKEKEV